eukprot:3933600-Rhodomonas_salina.1
MHPRSSKGLDQVRSACRGYHKGVCLLARPSLCRQQSQGLPCIDTDSGFWGMFWGLIIGVILAAVLDERSNAGAVVLVGSLDFVILTLFNPDGAWMEVAKNI